MTGLEPATTCLKGMRSTKLSYIGIFIIKHKSLNLLIKYYKTKLSNLLVSFNISGFRGVFETNIFLFFPSFS